METRGNRPCRSFFWPVLLIGVGVIWLMSNFGLISTNALAMLANLWPLILVVIGLDLLFGRRSPLVGGLIALLLVGALVFALIAAPVLGLKLPNTAEVKQERFTEPVGQAASATFRLDSGSEPVEVTPLSGSDLLVDADITHVGTMEFRASGTTDKSISLRRLPMSGMTIAPFSGLEQKWKVQLSTQVPMRLSVDAGSGPVAMDLEGMKLTGLDLNAGSGPVSLTLPNGDQHYDVKVDSGSGPVSVRMPGGTDMALSVDMGSGPLDILLPTDTAVRLEVLDNGSGMVTVPARLARLTGQGNEDEGTWETNGYASAARKLLIRVTSMGSGPVTIR